MITKRGDQEEDTMTGTKVEDVTGREGGGKRGEDRGEKTAREKEMTWRQGRDGRK